MEKGHPTENVHDVATGFSHEEVVQLESLAKEAVTVAVAGAEKAAVDFEENLDRVASILTDQSLYTVVMELEAEDDEEIEDTVDCVLDEVVRDIEDHPSHPDLSFEEALVTTLGPRPRAPYSSHDIGFLSWKRIHNENMRTKSKKILTNYLLC